MASVGPARPEDVKTETVADDRRRNHFERHAADRPELLPALRVVGGHTPLAVDDELVARARVDHDGRPPPDRFGPRSFPDGLASLGVKGGNKRLLLTRAFVILIDEKAIFVEHRRSSGTVIVVDGAELAVPDDLAAHVEADQPVTPERRVDHAPVGRRRGRRVPILLVHLFNTVGRNSCFPELLAIGAIERDERQPGAVRLRSRQEDPIAPDDRRGIAGTGHGYSPLHVARGRPRIRVLPRQ